jgi:hypothetical protein
MEGLRTSTLMEMSGRLYAPAALLPPSGTNWKEGWMGREVGAPRFLVRLPVFWHVTQCSVADIYQRFAATCCLFFRVYYWCND